MVEEIPGEHRVTLRADKGYDRKEFVHARRGLPAERDIL
jgi:hypothetical protein